MVKKIDVDNVNLRAILLTCGFWTAPQACLISVGRQACFIHDAVGMFFSTLCFDFTAVIAFTAVDFSNLAVKVANRTGAFSGPVCPCLEPLVRFLFAFDFEFTAVDVMILTLIVFIGNREISVFQFDCTRILVQDYPRKCNLIRSQ